MSNAGANVLKVKRTRPAISELIESTLGARVELDAGKHSNEHVAGKKRLDNLGYVDDDTKPVFLFEGVCIAEALIIDAALWVEPAVERGVRR